MQVRFSKTPSQLLPVIVVTHKMSYRRYCDITAYVYYTIDRCQYHGMARTHTHTAGTEFIRTRPGGGEFKRHSAFYIYARRVYAGVACRRY